VLLVLLSLSRVPAQGADATWISTSSTAWSSGANWSGGFPGATVGAFLNDGLSVQHTVDIGLNLTTVLGIQFNAFAGGSGFTINGTGGSPLGFKLQNGGTANGIINNDENTQTFNVPIGLYTFTGFLGGPQTWNAASGPIVVTGIYGGSANTVANNGGRLTVSGAFDTTIGSPTGRGDIVGTGGLTKSGLGTLTLGGTVANTYSGLTILNQGTLKAAKANAFGTGSLLLNGGTLDTGGFNQSLGTLAVAGLATIDLADGASTLTFAASSATNWLGSVEILNWTEGVDSVRFGTTASGLTPDQVARITFPDNEGRPSASIDPNGFIVPVPVPEPSAVALALAGGFGMVLFFRRNRR
jgi:autotransporter-associated beta strand protein